MKKETIEAEACDVMGHEQLDVSMHIGMLVQIFTKVSGARHE